MARVMVLWADSVLEYRAIGSDEEGKGSVYEAVDRLDPFYRRMYFWRGLTITLASAQKLLNALIQDPEFKEWLAGNSEHRERFFREKKQFDRHIAQVLQVRNRIAGHIEEDVGNCLTHIEPGTRDFIDYGGPDLLRPRLAIQFILATLLPDVPAEERFARFKELLTIARKAFDGMIRALEIAVSLYKDAYPLFPR